MRLAVEYWGVCFEILCEVREEEENVANLLLPVWENKTSTLPEATFRLIRNGAGELEAQGPDIGVSFLKEEAIEALERHIHLFIAMRTRQAVFVHAGVVNWQGNVILFPGPSFAGKSTLVRALCQAGATYMSDEYGIVDTEGFVHPFPRPMSRRRQTRGNLRTPPEKLGWTGNAAPLKVGAVVSVRYRENQEFQIEPLSGGNALLELMANTVSAREAPELALACLGRALSQAQCWKGVRGEARMAAKKILGLLR